MRLLFLLEDYHRYYTRRLRQLPELARASYDRQVETLFGDFFYVGDGYEHAMGARGHEATTLIPGCLQLQETWAREQGLPKTAAWKLKRETLYRQIKQYRPDVLYVFSGAEIDGRLMAAVRPYVGLFVLQWSAALRPDVAYRAFDLVLTTLPDLVEHFHGQGIACELITHSFDPRLLSRLGRQETRSGAVFIGSLQDARNYRIEVVETLARGLEGFSVYAPNLDSISPDSPVRGCFRGESFGLPMHEVYAGARIGVHVAGDEVRGYAGARRFFEIAGAGALLLTEAQAGLDRIFDLGKELVIFEGAEDCLAKVRHFLSHESEANAIARAGHERVLRDHTVTCFATRLEAILVERMQTPRRRRRRWFPFLPPLWR